MKDTIIINLYAGPCAGKSTIAAGIFYELKCKGYDCELVTEFAKDKVWEESYKILDDQIYVFGKQYHKIKRLIGKVDIIITDSPLPLSAYYDKEQNTLFRQLVIQEFKKFNNLNYFITRGDSYNENGRVHTYEQAIQIDKEIIELLKQNNIKFKGVPQEFAVKNIVNDILTNKLNTVINIASKTIGVDLVDIKPSNNFIVSENNIWEPKRLSQKIEYVDGAYFFTQLIPVYNEITIDDTNIIKAFFAERWNDVYDQYSFLLEFNELKPAKIYIKSPYYTWASLCGREYCYDIELKKIYCSSLN